MKGCYSSLTDRRVASDSCDVQGTHLGAELTPPHEAVAPLQGSCAHAHNQAKGFICGKVTLKNPNEERFQLPWKLFLIIDGKGFHFLLPRPV